MLFSSRKTLGISVTPELAVKVVAPQGSAIEKIKEKVLGKAPWILRQLDYFEGFHPLPSGQQYVGGASFQYLGRHYRLRIEIGPESWVKLLGAFLVVSTPDKDKVPAMVDGWFRTHAIEKITEIAQGVFRQHNHLDVIPSSVVFRSMARRWGSCTAEGKMILNPALIHAPRGCIEYVIIHELCHLVHHDHSRLFYELQERLMPGWRRWKERLEGGG